ncbi:MAG: queuosine salvage family protein [Nanoarchaeota archaeon]
MGNNVLETTKFVVDNSKHVRINKNKIKDFCKNFNYHSIKNWMEYSPFNIESLSDNKKLHFLLIFNAISFSYWSNPKWSVEYNGKIFDRGSWSLVVALGRAIDEEIPILNPNYLSNISDKDLRHILRGNTTIPLFEERLKILREIGIVLVKRFDGDFSNLVKLAKKDAIKLVKLIVSNFSNFNDISEYGGKKIFFYKRAQALVEGIYSLFKGKGFGNLKNISKLTACADYKIPQILRKLGILVYDNELSGKIDNQIEIPKGNELEIEIRANTIWAVEYIKKELRVLSKNINSIHINDYLWLNAGSSSIKEKPHHLTRTIFY